MFFFFDNDRPIAKSFLMTSAGTEEEQGKVLSALNAETKSQGLRNVDLTMLLGWSKAKASKITSGKQPLTADDIKGWSRALGYTPDAFISPDCDRRTYSVSTYLRTVSECLEAYFNTTESDPEHDAIMEYELPLALFQLFGVQASDYVVRASASYSGINPLTKEGLGDTASYIRLWQRTTYKEDEMTPEIGIWLSPENDFFLISVYLNRRANDGAMGMLRNQYKDALQVDEKDQEEFDSYSRKEEWIPRYVREGEIVAVGADTNNLPGPGDLEGVLVKLFRDYCTLVWEVKGMDILPEAMKNPERGNLTPFETMDIINGVADFFEEDKEKVVEEADYKCEIDPNHTSFTGYHGREFMDVAPIIPFGAGMQFGQAIYNIANAACVCPNCKAQMKYGQAEDREDMLIKLFRKHKNRMKECGIDVTTTQVLFMNGL